MHSSALQKDQIQRNPIEKKKERTTSVGREEEREPPKWASELWPWRPDLGLI